MGGKKGTILNELTISETGLVFDQNTGSIFTTNTTGIAIIEALKRNKDIPEITKLISGEYECDEKTLEKDILEFMNQLKAHQLVKDA